MYFGYLLINHIILSEINGLRARQHKFCMFTGASRSAHYVGIVFLDPK